MFYLLSIELSPKIERLPKMADSGGHSTDEEVEFLDRTDASDASSMGSSNSSAVKSKKARVAKTKPFSNPVHRWFDDDLDARGVKNSKCIICGKKFSGRHATALKNHLESKHPDQFGEFKKLQDARMDLAPAQKAQPSLEHSSQQTSVDVVRKMTEHKDGWKKGSIPYEKAVKSIAIGWVANSLPYQLIDEPTIRNMFKETSDGYLVNLPHRQEFTMRIKQLSIDLNRWSSQNWKMPNTFR